MDKKTFDKKLEAFIKKAKVMDKNWNVETDAVSSLHKIINTKEKADRFMKLLKDEGNR